jgi:hypothetical protein
MPPAEGDALSGELLIRPSQNDHEVIADLLAPGGATIMVGKQRPLVHRLVIDAPIAAKRPQFAEAAEGAGIPFLVDPLTTLLQGEVREDDPWARLSFARADVASPGEYLRQDVSAAFVASVVDFELKQGATAVIAPYPYIAAPKDEWLTVALAWLNETRRYMDRWNIGLPFIAILCGQLRDLGAEKAWGDGIDLFARTAENVGAQAIGLCLSPAGDGKESYNKVLRLFHAAEHLKTTTSLQVFAWRQGVFGPALVAAGLDGYESGIGTSEQSNVRNNIAARRPPKPGQKPGGGGPRGIYLEPLGRSINPRVAQLLLANVSLRAKLMCNDERCCPQGVTSTLDHYREHAVRSRARELGMLASLPARSWRLNHIATNAQGAVTLAHQANRLLAEVGEQLRVHPRGIESLQHVAEELGRSDVEARAIA